MMKKKKIWLAILIIIIIILIVVFWLIRHNKHGQDETQYGGLQLVELRHPDLLSYHQHIEAVGEIAPWEEAIISSDLSAVKLVESRVEIGDQVKKNQIIALLDSSFIASEYKIAQAERAKALVALENATNNAKRINSLKNTGALSDVEIEQYLAQEKTAKAQLQAIDAQLANQQLRLQHTKIIAPDDGVISEKLINLGEMVAVGQPLFKIIRQGRIEWQAKVGSNVVSQIKLASPVEIIDESGNHYQGEVRLISPVIDAKTRDATIYVQLNDLSLSKIPSGSFVKGRFIFPEQQGFAIEQSALLIREGKTWVFVLAKNSTVKQQEVMIGPRKGNKIIILAGVKKDDKIVQRGGEFLYDGSKVKLLEDTAKPIKDKH